MAKKLTRKEKIALQQEEAKKNPAPVKKNAPQAKRHSRLTRNLAFLIAGLAFLLYANTLSFDYARDDYSIITENVMTKKGFDAVKEIMGTTYRTGYSSTDYELYRPLSKAVFAIEWGLSGNQPNPHLGHWIHVLFYALTGFLLFYALSLYMNGNLLLAFLASSLFIAHPIHTEVAANIKSLDEVMGLLFFVIAAIFVYFYLERNSLLLLGIAMFSYFLSMLSKESSITFVAVLPLLIWFFTKAPSSKNVTATLALVLVAGIFLAIRSSVIGKAASSVGLGGSIVSSGVSVADNLLAGQDFGHRFATAVFIMGIYLKQLFFPAVLCSDRSIQDIPVVGLGDWRFLLSLAVYAGLGIYALLRFRKKDPVAFGILFFFITASVASNIPMLIGTSYGERLMYTPSLGFCIAIAALPVSLFKTEEGGPGSVREFFKTFARPLAAAGVILLLFGFRTVTRNPDWHDNIALALSDVEVAPNSTRSHFYLGNAISQDEFLSQQDSSKRKMYLDSANHELTRAVNLYPGFADAWQQMAKNYGSLHDQANAEVYYKKALELNPNNSMYLNNYGYLQFNMATEEVNTGIKLTQAHQDSAAHVHFANASVNYENARKNFEEAVRWNPKYTDAYNNLGAAYGTLGENLKSQGNITGANDCFEKAIFNFKKVVELEPSRTGAYQMIANTYRNMGNASEAQRYQDMVQTGGK
jgi:Tfp pilus assembly protein PilF